MAVTLIKNGKVITPFRMLKDGYVVFEDGIIREVGTGEPGALGAHETVDAGGMYVSPGFIDIHTHGGGGYDYMDNDVESFHGAARTHLCFGTTTIVPTTLTSTNEELKLSLETFKKAKYTPHDGAYLHGLHLEGPYFSMANKGAQDPRYIRDPKPEEYNEILSWSDEIVRWSIAPELPGALALGRELRRRGIVASAG
ncbi:MAG: amidohydrolase family protein, partial [Clostridia bacterium]|nr:amidohydrolase family protein [Clostridia bacterium]